MDRYWAQVPAASWEPADMEAGEKPVMREYLSRPLERAPIDAYLSAAGVPPAMRAYLSSPPCLP